jgi:hypothetical protein
VKDTKSRLASSLTTVLWFASAPIRWIIQFVIFILRMVRRIFLISVLMTVLTLTMYVAATYGFPVFTQQLISSFNLPVEEVAKTTVSEALYDGAGLLTSTVVRAAISVPGVVVGIPSKTSGMASAGWVSALALYDFGKLAYDTKGSYALDWATEKRNSFDIFSALDLVKKWIASTASAIASFLAGEPAVLEPADINIEMWADFKTALMEDFSNINFLKTRKDLDITGKAKEDEVVATEGPTVSDTTPETVDTAGSEPTIKSGIGVEEEAEGGEGLGEDLTDSFAYEG